MVRIEDMKACFYYFLGRESLYVQVYDFSMGTPPIVNKRVTNDDVQRFVGLGQIKNRFIF